MSDKRTYTDRREYLKFAVAKRRKVLLEKAIVLKGGSCQICGYSKSQRALCFHHIDPAIKSFGISAKGITRAWHKVRAELDKCILLCSNCHAEVHDGITQLPTEK